ncbi:MULTISPECIES: hypothetical protein [unclassified Microbacterium]|uniref:hypothetical protein n=2 Tax=Microbacterium TaxID=33882 RepID=UPI0022F04142|nr:hypothetical protein [Streptomyces sp. MS2A]
MWESRVLGPIELDGGSGGGWMDTEIDFLGTPLPVRLEIDHPDRLTQSFIDGLDVVLERLEIPDRISRDAIASALRNEASAPAQLYRAWERTPSGARRSADEFLAGLQPRRMTITPDGGRVNLDRVVLKYGLADASVSGEITVRLPAASSGPEIDPAPRQGY